MTRAGKAGRKLGESIIEIVNLMYQNNTAMNFLYNLLFTIVKEINKRNGGEVK